MTERNAIHRPVNMDPAAYEYVGVFWHDPDEGTYGHDLMDLVLKSPTSRWSDPRWFGQCDHCGARINYVAVLRHTPTGDHIAVGEQCLDNRFSLVSKEEFQRMRKAVQLERQKQRIKNEAMAWLEEHPDVVRIFSDKVGDPRVEEIKGRLFRYGSLWDSTVAYLRDIAENKTRAQRDTITARFGGRCSECDGWFNAGDEIRWDRVTRKARHTEGQCKDPRKDIAIEDAGVYVMPDGRIVKVKANRSKTRTYAMLWTETSSIRKTESGWYRQGDYVYAPRLIDEVAESGRKMTLDEAKEFIVLYGQCCRCGRNLKTAQSVERGIGPVCIRYFKGEAA